MKNGPTWYRTVRTANGSKTLHTLIAGKALGKPIPLGAEVHHVDGNRINNNPSNLVICPSAKYHKLLHMRQEAFEASGNVSWRKCQFCKQYDDPANGVERGPAFRHRQCEADYTRANRAKKRA